MTPSGTAVRLAWLEDRDRARVAAVEAAKDDTATRDWSEVAGDTPEGLPYTRPPVGGAAYFECEAGRCATVEAKVAGKVLLEAVQTAGRWSAALWRYEEAFAMELGEGIDAWHAAQTSLPGCPKRQGLR